ncbi:bifunctional diaminohydroxyphosphoribosylaminopyrimidine deaminase/5-amino-6-(5-phosphoribosylamino)uracil reductase RibD [Agaribacterium haliotis]|uniref:bifunctional diaminohydroxyphosphoribosylaminopyrimidine deaminase/5-amino-6-(5-phosphoribosylamino)uracil reductase RibD n=1 Tax=Agaribacterium haliotis TaxID=2013869 RepID=UPI000BB56EAB|nr:bifunctional diaminohydroxyphosphoribosylaminopyrimidine deaminase/5-amino-6-(5-phosphoribosylamino)uracil reductase RibD [Agaribacterium haliotis]
MSSEILANSAPSLSATKADRDFMQQAIALAKHGLNSCAPNPRVGCVLVRDGAVVGRGWHQRAGEAHAEINALADAGDNARTATAYVTLEPCSHQGRTGPCADALIAAGISRVVYGMLDPNPEVSGAGLAKLKQAGVELLGPLLEDEARALNPGFIKRMELGQPYIRIKSAMSLDGRTAMASGESKWITAPAAREDVQKLRARSCALITGVGSVVHDDPSLTVRLGDDDRQPLRVIVDSSARCPRRAQIFEKQGRTVIACLESAEIAADDEREFWRLPERDGKVDLHALVKRLAAENCNEILVETGAELAGAFVGEALVDEFIVYIAPKFMGSHARPLFELPISTMSGHLPLIIKDIRAVGYDWRVTALPDPDS